MLFHKKARKHRWDVEKYNKIKQVREFVQYINLLNHLAGYQHC